MRNVGSASRSVTRLLFSTRRIFGFIWTLRGKGKFRTLGLSFEGCDESDIIRYPVFTDEGDPAALAGIRLRRRPELPSSSEAYKVAKSWIDDCVSNHLCWSSRVMITQDGHPARLIDLEASLPFNEEHRDVRIVPYRSTSHSYATLSYCWGATMPPGSVTTQNNIAKRLKRLEVSSLPRTLQDAFTVTRQLGIRYLWVDALCIIQDDPNDWAIEAAKMASIYDNCLVSIAVELGSDCTAGFLSHTPEQEDFCIDRLIKIPNQLKSGKVSNLYIWTPIICGCFYDRTIDSLKKTALSKRGWTYQERYLAPRILHFIGAQIVWECRAVYGVSLERGSSLDDTILHRSPSTFGDVAMIKNQHENIQYREELREHWYNDIIPEISRRKLSQKSDKLPAISGIAKRFGQRLVDTYFAGLWLGDIVYGLSWTNGTPAEYPGFYRAPTICWSSVDGDVHYPGVPRDTLTHYVHLVDHRIDFQGPDSFGCVTGGWIKIVGYLGDGVVQGDKLLDEKTDFILGHPYFDANRYEGRNEGRSVKYLPLWSALPGHSHVCRVLLLQQRGQNASEFERIGLSTSGNMDVHINHSWLSKNCTKIELTLF